MAFDFPASPPPGALYQPAGGPTYQWDGQKWIMAGSPVQQTPAYAQRNRIVNGAMQVSQENGYTAGTVVSYFVADQFITGGIVGTFAFSAQRVQAATPRGSANRFRMTVTTAQASLAAGNVLNIQSKIEGIRVDDFLWGSANARQVVLRFGWKSPAGTWSVVLRQLTNRSYVANFTISAAQANTDTEQVIVIPGDTAGTWPIDTTEGLNLTFTIAVGSTYQGSSGWQAGNFMGTSSNSNGVATNGSVFELFDVGLYLDTQKSGLPPAWEEPDYATELWACRRYWQVVDGNANYWSGSTTASTPNYIAARPISPVMRTNPTITGVNANAANFPATVGSLNANAGAWNENRTANATGAIGYYASIITLNARM